jgi:hypothetical protein
VPLWQRLVIRWSPAKISDRVFEELFHLSNATIRKYRYGRKRLENNRPPAGGENRLRVHPSGPVLDVPAGSKTVPGAPQ